MGKSKKQLADEAYMRSMETLDGRAPVPEGVLPGQLAIDGSVAGTSGREIPHPIKGVPETCPRCGLNMIIVYGGKWTPMYKDDGVNFGKLQCGDCGFVITVSVAAWDAVRAERKRTIGRSDAPPPPKREKKQRGAG